MDVASGLLEYRSSASDDTQELVGDMVADRVGNSSVCRLAVGGDKFSFKSSFRSPPLPFLRLMFLSSIIL
ncbi:hypothetical protein Hanom_Chr14g01276881 [Helianthus anomalus]